MGNLKFTVDVDKIAAEFGDLKLEVEAAVTEAVKAASAMSYAKAQELASEKLTSRLKIYQDALSYKEVLPGFWVVELDEKAMWIEDGQNPHSMVPDLLRKNAKVSKSGELYKVIPFDQGKAPSEQSSNAKGISAILKQELKNRKIPFKKIELDEKGNPRMGKLHSFSVKNSPYPSPNAKYRALEGVSIYQSKNAKGKMRRDIMTFRVVKSSHQQEGLWFHPGTRGVLILDNVFSWINTEFDNNILPSVLAKFG